MYLEEFIDFLERGTFVRKNCYIRMLTKNKEKEDACWNPVFCYTGSHRQLQEREAWD